MKERTAKECFIRAARTFGQAAAGYIVANAAASLAGVVKTDMLKSTLIGLGVSAVAAGLSALMNLPCAADKSSGGETGAQDAAVPDTQGAAAQDATVLSAPDKSSGDGRGGGE